MAGLLLYNSATVSDCYSFSPFSDHLQGSLLLTVLRDLLDRWVVVNRIGLRVVQGLLLLVILVLFTHY